MRGLGGRVASREIGFSGVSRALLREAARQIAAASGADAQSAAIEARALFCAAAGIDAAAVWREDPIDEKTRARFADYARRRRDGEPVAYITGSREFFGLSLRATPAALVPRIETETLVESALDFLRDRPRARALELGAGGGAVCAAILRATPEIEMTATDISDEALSLARENLRRLGLCARLLRGDWFSALPANRGETFDCVLSNPPYLAADDPHLRAGDLRFEPRAALVAGRDAMTAIRRIAQDAPPFLRPGGRLILEHGIGQAAECENALVAAGLRPLGRRRDLAGIERVVCAGRD